LDGAAVVAATTPSAPLACQAAMSSPLAPLPVLMTSPSGVMSVSGSAAEAEVTRRPPRTLLPPKRMISTMVAASASPTTPASRARDGIASTRTWVGRGWPSHSCSTTLSVARTPKPAPVTITWPASAARRSRPSIVWTADSSFATST